MSQTKPGMLARMRSLWRGLFRSWVRDQEQQKPEVVYEQAIAERVRQYRELKDAVAGILYMRNKLESEIAERRAEIARLHDDVRRAVRRGEEETSLSLIAHKQALFEDLERAEQELEEVRIQAEEAKTNLVRFREEIRALVLENGLAIWLDCDLDTLVERTSRKDTRPLLKTGDAISAPKWVNSNTNNRYIHDISPRRMTKVRLQG